MNFLKYIFAIFLTVMLSQALLADGVNSGSQISKQGRFTKDNNFNKNGTRDLLPPDPGGGGDPNPLPAGNEYIIVVIGTTLYLSFKLLKNYKRKCHT